MDLELLSVNENDCFDECSLECLPFEESLNAVNDYDDYDDDDGYSSEEDIPTCNPWRE